MTVPTPGSAEAITYAEQAQSHQSRIVLSLGFPMWTAEKSAWFL